PKPPVITRPISQLASALVESSGGHFFAASLGEQSTPPTEPLQKTVAGPSEHPARRSRVFISYGGRAQGIDCQAVYCSLTSIGFRLMPCSCEKAVGDELAQWRADPPHVHAKALCYLCRTEPRWFGNEDLEAYPVDSGQSICSRRG